MTHLEETHLEEAQSLETQELELQDTTLSEATVVSTRHQNIKRQRKINAAPSYWHDVVIHLNGRSFMPPEQRVSLGLPAESCIDHLLSAISVVD